MAYNSKKDNQDTVEEKRKADALANLPKTYSKLKDTDFPMIIGGIEYKTKQELADRYQADLMALAELLYDIYQDKKAKDKLDKEVNDANAK